MSTSLGPLHAPNTVGSPSAERRAAPRHPLLQRCFVWPPGAQGEGWRCVAYNISATGIGLTLPLPLLPGTVLRVEPWELPAARILRARVVHVRAVECLWF